MACGSLVCNAATVQFNDANRGPGASLNIGGVNASTSTIVWTNSQGFSPSPSQVGTTSGVGMGCVGLGSADSFDLLFHYSAGESSYDWSVSESASLTLDDASMMITSVTIAPHVTATVGSLDPVTVELPFTTYLFPSSGGGPGGHQIAGAGDATFTVSFYDGPESPFFITSQLDLSCALNGMGDGFPANQFRQQNISDDVTLDYGFTIVSLNFAAVPEPGTASLLGLGLLGLYYSRRNCIKKS